MAIAHIASISATPGANGGTSSAIDTTGANLIVVGVGWHSAASATPTITDSKGNTWTGLTQHVWGNGRHKFYYVLTPTVGTGHTFTVVGTSIYATMFVRAFSGVGSFQVESGNVLTVSGAGPVASGSVTPSANGALIVSGLSACCSASTDSITPSGFTLSTVGYVFGNMQSSIAWQVQTTAAAINPTWTCSVPESENIGVSTAVFLEGAPPPTEIRVTQDAIELLNQPVNVTTRVSQDVIELLSLPFPAVRMTQYVVEILGTSISTAPTVTETTQFFVILP